jgi:aspartate carbamoyltransferase catalytic subunit
MRRHLLGIEQLSKDQLLNYLENAKSFIEVSNRELKKVPALRGKTIINLFLEPSTRTRASFEIAGKRLSADTINISGSDSSVVKGETLLDTARNLQAMTPDAIVVRHKESGAAQFLSKHIKEASIINAGDGMHEHPTQALLDCLSIKQFCEENNRKFEKLKVAIVGDVLHSRVARSNILAHQLLGNKICLIAPPTLLPPKEHVYKAYGNSIEISYSLAEGLYQADVVMVLRMQLERQANNFIPSLEEYSAGYCVTEKMLQKYAPNSVVLHPGPINRGIEISTEVADGKRSIIERQVTYGVAIRMAVLFALCSGNLSQEER